LRGSQKGEKGSCENNRTGDWERRKEPSIGPLIPGKILNAVRRGRGGGIGGEKAWTVMGGKMQR